MNVINQLEYKIGSFPFQGHFSGKIFDTKLILLWEIFIQEKHSASFVACCSKRETKAKVHKKYEDEAREREKENSNSKKRRRKNIHLNETRSFVKWKDNQNQKYMSCGARRDDQQQKENGKRYNASVNQVHRKIQMFWQLNQLPTEFDDSLLRKKLFVIENIKKWEKSVVTLAQDFILQKWNDLSSAVSSRWFRSDSFVRCDLLSGNSKKPTLFSYSVYTRWFLKLKFFVDAHSKKSLIILLEKNDRMQRRAECFSWE